MTDLVLIRKIQMSDLQPDDLLHNYGNAEQYVQLYIERARELASELHKTADVINSRTVWYYGNYTMVLDNHPLVSLHATGDRRVYCDLYNKTVPDDDCIMVQSVTELYAFLIYTYPYG